MITTVENPVFAKEEGKIKVFVKGYMIQILDPRDEPTDQEGFQARATEHQSLVDYCETNDVTYAEKEIS